MTRVPSLKKLMQAGWPHRALRRPQAMAAGLAALPALPAPIEAVALLRWAPDLAGVAILAGSDGHPNRPVNIVLAGPELLLAAAIHAKLAHWRARARAFRLWLPIP